MQITIKAVNQYGNIRYFPGDEQADRLLRLFWRNRKTFNKTHLDELQSFGVLIKVITDDKEV